MSSKGPGERRGVIVAVDYHSHLLATIEAAIALAAARHMEVHGLYMEDPDLAVVASLPFSQEISLLGAQPRVLENQHLHRSLERFTRRFRQLLAEQAQQSSLDYSFSSRAGKKRLMDLVGDLQPDYLVLGLPRPAQIPRRKEPHILMISADTAVELPVLDALLARMGDRPVQLLVVESMENNADDDALRAFVAEHPGVSVRHLALQQLTAVLRSAQGQPNLVITSRELDPALLDNVLQLAACPVILAT